MWYDDILYYYNFFKVFLLFCIVNVCKMNVFYVMFLLGIFLLFIILF